MEIDLKAVVVANDQDIEKINYKNGIPTENDTTTNNNNKIYNNINNNNNISSNYVHNDNTNQNYIDNLLDNEADENIKNNNNNIQNNNIDTTFSNSHNNHKEDSHTSGHSNEAYEHLESDPYTTINDHPNKYNHNNLKDTDKHFFTNQAFDSHNDDLTIQSTADRNTSTSDKNTSSSFATPTTTTSHTTQISATNQQNFTAAAAVTTTTSGKAPSTMVNLNTTHLPASKSYETIKEKSENCCENNKKFLIAMLVATLSLLLLAVIGLAVGLGVTYGRKNASPVKEAGVKQTAYTCFMRMNASWNDELLLSSSQPYTHTSAHILTQMRLILDRSQYANVYTLLPNVTFRQGSVLVQLTIIIIEANSDVTQRETKNNLLNVIKTSIRMNQSTSDVIDPDNDVWIVDDLPSYLRSNMPSVGKQKLLPKKASCSKLTFAPCLNLGYDYTINFQNPKPTPPPPSSSSSSPSSSSSWKLTSRVMTSPKTSPPTTAIDYDFEDLDLSSLGKDLFVRFLRLLNRNCHNFTLDFVCSRSFPRCQSGGNDGNDTFVLPCKRFCEEISLVCLIPIDCHDLVSDHDPDICYMPSHMQRSPRNVEKCERDRFQCDNGRCISWGSVCNEEDNCGDASDEEECQRDSNLPYHTSFERGEWENFVPLLDSSFPWSLVRAGTLDAGGSVDGDKIEDGNVGLPPLKPLKDHTKNSEMGWVVVARSSGYAENDVARMMMTSLMTSKATSTATHCLKFFYHGLDISSGGSGSRFKIYTTNTFNDIPQMVWSQMRSQSSTWSRGQINLQAGTLKVIFEYVRGANYAGDLAVDDVILAEGPCPRLECNVDEFGCANNHTCIPAALKCDQVNDCLDNSDETNCVCRIQKEFQCQRGGCVSAWKRCDGQPDCSDKSDELQCECPKGQFKCATNKTASPSSSSPSSFFSSSSSSFSSSSSSSSSIQCIMSEWVCDGEVDCHDASDESNCDRCNVDKQYQCTNGQCVDKQMQCNGRNDCADWSDELGCVKLDLQSIVFGFYGNTTKWIPACFDHVTDDVANSLCRYLNMGNMTSKSPSYMPGDNFYTFSASPPSPPANPNLITNQWRMSTSCVSQQALGLTCSPATCSFHSNMAVPQQSPPSSSLSSLSFSSSQLPPPLPPPQPIVNGNDARPDTWPWQAALFYFKKQLCGASLLDERHVVTAAHCLDISSEPSDYTLMLGSIDKSSEASGNLFTNRASFIQVQNFTVHPNYTSFSYYWGNDIAILRLATPVRFNRAVSPVCLVDPQYDVITTSSICYALGWGLTNFYNSTSDATILQVAKLKLWSWDECRKTNFFISPSMICAGYAGGIIANCKGDSGGPLVCRNSISSGSSSINSFSPWRLVGVFTFLSTGCDVVLKPSVFTNVSYHSQWLKSAMSCPFACDNGATCLWNTSKICDGTADCLDVMDEDLDNCASSINCTFEDVKVCGYKSLKVNLGGEWERSKGQVAMPPLNYGPIYDHTTKTTSGHFMLGGSSEAHMVSPVVHVQSDSCLLFYLLTRGPKGIGQLYVHRLAMEEKEASYRYLEVMEDSNEVYRSSLSVSDSMWYPVKISVPPGLYSFVFAVKTFTSSSHEPMNFIAIDDVTMLDVACEEEVCGPDAMKCDYEEIYTCESLKSTRCNVFSQCGGITDELNCRDSLFNCNMDDFLQCDLRQLGTPLDDADWSVTNVSSTYLLDAGGPPPGQSHGNILYLDTSPLAPDGLVVLEIPVFISESTGIFGCFQFHYSMVDESELRVVMVPMDIDSFIARRTFVMKHVNEPRWAVMELPLDFYTSTIRFEVKKPLTSSTTAANSLSYIALDDFFIYRGQCQLQKVPSTYKCGAGDFAADKVFKCRDGSGCLYEDFVCDMSDNCADGSDESNCATYKCPTGTTIINKSLRCNGHPDCYRGEDEMNCVCAPGEVACQLGSGCYSMAKRCNGVLDCLDRSDEVNCSCARTSTWCAPYNKCLLDACDCPDELTWINCKCDGFMCKDTPQCLRYGSRVCDGFEDCNDGSDENNCSDKSCKEGQVRCPGSSRCVEESWLCDGYSDCSDGWDERNCNQCNPVTSFQCKYKYACVELSKKCNGVSDCPDGSDEINCFIQPVDPVPILKGFSGEQATYVPFCSVGWNNVWNNKVCTHLDMDSSIGDVILNNATRMHNWYFVRIDGGGIEFDMKKFNLSRSCGSNRTIQLQCTPKTCGLSTAPTVGAYIIGGDVVQKEAQWPFMAALMRHNKHICGGTLVHERFVLTAAHCFVFSSTDDKHRPMFDHPNHFSVRLGSTKNIGSTKHLQVIRVEKIHIYHLYNFNDNKYNLDIALVELEKPATLNDYVATACLPKPEEKAPLCYGLGWGYTNIDDFGIDPVVDLRQVKLQELDPEVCKTLDASHVNDASKLCVGYLTNSIKPCHGDSGGPLICRHPSGRWLVRGLVSSGSDDYGSCASPNGVKPTMFTNVVDFIDWIQTIIKSAK